MFTPNNLDMSINDISWQMEFFKDPNKYFNRGLKFFWNDIVGSKSIEFFYLGSKPGSDYNENIRIKLAGYAD